jgi:hypothetical protein
VDYQALNDHPSNVLRDLATDLYKEIQGEIGLDRAALEARADAFAKGATALRTYELLHGVTFVALDNDTLDALIELYRSNDEDGDLDRVHYVTETVGELLGLDN